MRSVLDGITDSSAQVADCIDRICQSAEFARSPQMIRFLRYVTDAALSGSGGPVRERNIGVHVFQKSTDWDPKADPIVRTEARRLRRKLDTYYATVGNAEPVRIEIPKGGYLPVFLPQTVPQKAEFVTLPRTSIESLSAAASESSQSTPYPARRAPTIWRTAAALAAIVAMAALVAFAFKHPGKKAVPVPQPLHLTPFADALGQESSAAISPDGRKIAYSWDGDAGNFDIYIKPVSGGSPRRLTTAPAYDLFPAWSPDGSRIAFLRGTPDSARIFIKAVDGGAEREITSIHPGAWSNDLGDLAVSPGPAWSSDGASLIVTDFSPGTGGYGLYAVPLDSGPRRRLTSPEPLAHDLYPRPSHDGRLLAFARCYSRSSCNLFVMDAHGSLRPIVRQLSDIYGISWLADDRRLIYASNRAGASQLWSVDLSGADPAVVPTESAQSSDPAIAPDGSFVAYTVSHRNWNIWRACLTCGSRRQELFISSSGRNRGPRYSPDGRQIAFISDRSGAWEIWTCDADGQNLRKLTHFGGPFVGGLAWSPDGRVIAFDARINGHSAVYFIDREGGSPRLMEKNEFEDRMPNWSSDGKWVYFNSNRAGGVRIWKKYLPDGKPVQVSGTTAFKAMETVGGRDLYFDADVSGFWVSSPDGSDGRQVQPLRAVLPRQNWWLTSTRLFFTDEPTDRRTIQAYDLSTGKIESVLKSERPLVAKMTAMTVSPDQKWILFAEEDYVSSDIYLRGL